MTGIHKLSGPNLGKRFVVALSEFATELACAGVTGPTRIVIPYQCLDTMRGEERRARESSAFSLVDYSVPLDDYASIRFDTVAGELTIEAEDDSQSRLMTLRDAAKRLVLACDPLADKGERREAEAQLRDYLLRLEMSS